MKNVIPTWVVIAILALIATALQVSAQDAQRKEINPQCHTCVGTGMPTQQPPDAQRKEAPTIRPITVVIDWLTRIGIVPAAQRKE